MNLIFDKECLRHRIGTLRPSTSVLMIVICGVCLRPNTARSTVPSAIKTIVVEAGTIPADDEDSSTRREIAKRLLTSPVFREQNIIQTAADYLTSHLQGKVSVLAWTPNLTFPRTESTMLLRIEGNVWPQDINGRQIVVGALSLHPMRFALGSQTCFEVRRDANGFEPLESYIVTDDQEETQRNLKAAITRLLEQYATTEEGPSNK